MKRELLLLTALIGATLLLIGPSRATPTDAAPAAAAGSGIVTLYAHDDRRSSIDFRTGGPGGRIIEGERILDDAHMTFGVFAEDMLSFGFIRDEPVNIIDLGVLEIDGQARAKDRSPVVPMDLVQTLYLDSNRVAYTGPNNKMYRHKPAEIIFDPLPRQGMYHLEPVVGHTYLARYRHQSVGAADGFAKFKILDLRPGVSMTMYWSSVPQR